MSLPDIPQIISVVSADSIAVEAKWDQIRLPSDVKRDFCRLWKSQVGYDSFPVVGQTKLFTSASNAEYIADVALTKAILAFPLFKALHEYRDFAIGLVDEYSIPNFKAEFGRASSGEPPSWSEWLVAIDSASSLSDSDRRRLKSFLTDSQQFGGIKGIERVDFAAPAIIKAIGQRVDRFGIADDIARVSTQGLYDAVKDFVTDIPVKVSTLGPTGSLSYSKLVSGFRTALKTAGFAEPVREGEK